METKTIRLSEMTPAEYNPRKDLQPNDPEYAGIERSINEFGYIEPIIYNEQTGNIVSGHQRAKVLAAHGEAEATAVVVSLPIEDEKVLNVALNRISGHWDVDKLADLLDEIKTAGGLANTGFAEYELASLRADYGHINDLIEQEFSGVGKGGDSATFTITFTLPGIMKSECDAFMIAHPKGKEMLSAAVVLAVREAQG